MAHTNQLGNIPCFSITVKNNSGSDIAEGVPLSIDAANAIGTLAFANAIPVVVIAANGNACVGVSQMIIPAGGTGTARVLGAQKMVSDGAITAGGIVDGSATVGKGAKAHAAGKAQLGMALTTSADGEDVLVLLGVGALNA